MQKWVPATLLLTGINLVAVVATSVVHVMQTSNPNILPEGATQTAAVELATTNTPKDAPLSQPSGNQAKAPDLIPSLSAMPPMIAADADRTDALAEPNDENLPDLPDADAIPELELSPAEMERDPVFRAFQEMLTPSSTPSDSGTTPHGSRTNDYDSAILLGDLKRLENRILSAKKLTDVAAVLVQEAQRSQAQSDDKTTRRMLDMAMQARELAAQLLIEEL